MKFKNPISFLIFFLLLSVTCFSQSIVDRANSSYTVRDSRGMWQYNAFIPRYADTTAANVQKGIDTCGAIVYTYVTHSFWYRSCASSAKQWIQIAQPFIDSVTAIDEFAPDSVSSKLLSEWIPQETPLDRVWVNFTWSPELRRLVAVSHSGSGQDVMTSDDGGITWIARTTPAQEWRGVAWSSKLKLFAAVGGTGTGNRVMTSPDGITWTNRTSTGDYKWRDIVWSDEKEIFVAVANRSSGTGGGDRVMTSTDGITWTARVTPENDWSDIVWAKELGLFCVSATGNFATTAGIMTSPDGINWTSRTTPNIPNSWEGLTWSGDKRLFVAVSFGGAGGEGQRVMTSPDGITWTLRTTPQDAQWLSVAWSRELGSFAAVCDNLTSQIMTSPDGITWTLQTAPLVKQWRRIYWVKELGSFIAVAYTFSTSGVGNLIMRSRPLDLTGQYLNKFGNVDQTVQGDVTFNDSLINKKVLSATKLDVGVSATTASAIIDASSTTKGVIWPRMTTAQKNAIASPATGLQVFDTDLNQYNFYNGASWASMGGSSGITTLNTLTGATQTFATGTAGTDFNISSATSTHTFNLPSSSASNRGLLTAADWTTFNGKIGGSLTAGRIPFATAATTLSDNASFAVETSSGFPQLIVSTAAAAAELQLNNTSGHKWRLLSVASTDPNNPSGFGFYNDNIGVYGFNINNNGGVSIRRLTAATAWLHIAAGTATANTAPLKFTAGTNLTTPEAGAVEFDGTNYFGTASTTRYTLAKTLTATATLDFASTGSGAVADLTITVTGAADGDAVSLGVPNGSVTATATYSAWVSAANTVTVRFSPKATEDPASGTFRVSVIKY